MLSLIRQVSAAGLRPAPLTRLSGMAAPTLRRLPFGLRDLSTETRSKIEQQIKGSPVYLYMKGTPAAPACGFSRAVVQILEYNGLSFAPGAPVGFTNVLEDAEIREGIKEFSEWPTIPQLYVNGEFVGGCDILINMQESGEIGEFLAKHGVVALEDTTAKN
ncbi:hypothetical protein CXG81DRAFT_14907 [Caulochytrium protostelioides]|uniref:Monothiol glutaredoxin-5, mitochondrial n=1 Tax=Caulochytrium protostelioides TaxID=1555241 RepID=A0A4P9X0A5_9FUNG|nr:monothiol glutaredoxin-5 [Caulochytrium protostelioides]RKO99161.1 hypothetical protein CXG81DRAFT_14907 [Caulochytrium protostelioides]|eukprot:RKO99161.1 hypothetical protein CXG81DRAFT_14907 [Caulochytrium protostelioides]